MILSWLTTQTFQEQFEKLLQKSQPGGAKISHLAIFPGRSVFLMYLNTVSTSHPTFGINQLHFISHVSVLWSFHQCLACCNEGFSAPLIATSLYEAILVLWVHARICARLVQLTLPIVYHALTLSISTVQVHECMLLSGVRLLLLVLQLGIRDLGLSMHLLLFSYKHSSIVSCAWFIVSMVQL